jgi:hypothetical protein
MSIRINFLAAGRAGDRYPTIRPADPGDSPRLAQLFRATYGRTSHPCQDAGGSRASSLSEAGDGDA